MEASAADRGASLVSARVFISYASEDREIAQWVHDRIAEEGAGVWVDRESIGGGRNWKKEIADGLLKATALAFILTRHSLGRHREWIRYELSEAHKLFRPIFPLLFEDDLRLQSRLPKELRDVQFISFGSDPERWDQRLPELLSSLNRTALRSGPPGPEGKRRFEYAPASTDTFVGRTEELRKIGKLIIDQTHLVAVASKAVIIQGMGGLGKTMLAEEIVRRLQVLYPGGCIVVRRGHEDPDPALAILGEWAERAGLAPRQKGYSVERVQAALQALGQLLVLIDDVREADLQEVVELRTALPTDASCLVTTRLTTAQPKLGGEQFRLSRLTDEDARELVRTRLIEKNANLDRAVLDAELDRHEADLARLIDAVDGHALCLELAAGRCERPADLPTQVDTIIKGLAEGVGSLDADLILDRPTKDDSVRVSLEISLSDLEMLDRLRKKNWALRFAVLGVFPTGLPLPRRLILAIWGDEQASSNGREALRGLHARGMIHRDSEGDYSSHPVLRAYAYQLLDSVPAAADSARRRYLQFAVEAARIGFRRPRREWHEMDRYLPHLHHVGAQFFADAVRLLGDLDALAQPRIIDREDVPPVSPDARETMELMAAFAHATSEYVVRRPIAGDLGGDWLRLGLACARTLHRDSDIVYFLGYLGGWHSWRDRNRARQYFAAALALARELPDCPHLGMVLTHYGELLRKRDCTTDALKLLSEALEIHRGRDARIMEATTLKYLGEIHWRQLRLEESLEHYRQARAIYEDVDKRSGQADIMNKIGACHFNAGEQEKALTHFSAALEMHRGLGHLSKVAEDLSDMGISYGYLERFEQGRRHLEEALQIERRLGDGRATGICLANLAAVLLGLGEADLALERAGEALGVSQSAEALLPEMWALNWRGLAFDSLGDSEKALSSLEAALKIARDDLDTPRGLAGTLGNLGRVLGGMEEGKRKAREYVEEAIRVMKDHHVVQAFGGRRLADMEDLLEYLNAGMT